MENKMKLESRLEADTDSDIEFCDKMRTPSVTYDIRFLESDEITTVLIPTITKGDKFLNSDSETKLASDVKTQGGIAEIDVYKVKKEIVVGPHEGVIGGDLGLQKDIVDITSHKFLNNNDSSDDVCSFRNHDSSPGTNVDQETPEELDAAISTESNEIVTVLLPETKTRTCPSGKGKKRMSYDLETKLEAIKHAELYSKRSAARKYGVDNKRIREWCCYKAEIACKVEANCGKTRKRLGGGGRKVFIPAELENALVEWFKETRAKGESLKRKAISKKAEAMWKEMKNTFPNGCDNSQEEDTFKASDGWVTSFMRRQGLSL